MVLPGAVASLTLKECLALAVFITLMLGLLAFTYKYATGVLMPNDSGSSSPTPSMDFRKFYNVEMVVSVLTKISMGDVKLEVPLNTYLLKEAFEELERHPDIYENPKLYDFASEFMLETVKRAAFMKVPSDRKVAWLKSRYNRNMFMTSFQPFL